MDVYTMHLETILVVFKTQLSQVMVICSCNVFFPLIKQSWLRESLILTLTSRTTSPAMDPDVISDHKSGTPRHSKQDGSPVFLYGKSSSVSPAGSSSYFWTS